MVSALGTGYDEVCSMLGPRDLDDELRSTTDPAALEIHDWDASAYLGKKGHRNLDRLTKFLIVAARLALRHAGLKSSDGEFLQVDPKRVGLCSATAYGSLDSITELNRVAELEDPRYINPARFPNTVINSAPGYVGIWEGLRGPNATLVDGNCGSLNGFQVGATHLENQRSDAFLIGGGEIISEPLCLALKKLGVFSATDDSELDETQNGGVRLGEGACFVSVERPAEARARGATILGTVVGYGAAFDPPPEDRLTYASSRAVEESIAAALQDAGMVPSDVDAVCSSLGGLTKFDDAERTGIKAALGHAMDGRDLSVVEPKKIFGETLGAAGAFGVLASLALFSNADCAETPNTVVVTTLGYYGNASAVVLQRGDAPTETREA